jgi:hypothetical protein
MRAYFLHNNESMISMLEVKIFSTHVQGEALLMEYLYEYLVYDRIPHSISVYIHT